MKNTIIIFLVVAAIVGSVAFYGGMKYGQSSKSTDQNMVFSGQRQNFNGAAGTVTGATRRNGQGGVGMAGNGFLSGSIISKTDNSLTLSLQDGGSKIVFLPASAQISKFAAGSPGDLTVGANIMVNGATNTDGSLTASTIQLRPAAPIGGQAIQETATTTPQK